MEDEFVIDSVSLPMGKNSRNLTYEEKKRLIHRQKFRTQLNVILDMPTIKVLDKYMDYYDLWQWHLIEKTNMTILIYSLLLFADETVNHLNWGEKLSAYGANIVQQKEAFAYYCQLKTREKAWTKMDLPPYFADFSETWLPEDYLNNEGTT